MFTIFRNAFIRYRGQILGWGISLGALCLYMARFYNTIASQKEYYMKIVEAFPKEMMAFFGSSEAHGNVHPLRVPQYGVLLLHADHHRHLRHPGRQRHAGWR